jgi:diguanylate cyclase (GGDEF)-like protein
LFIDLDGFKQVNDQLGHAAGDGLLCDVAKILETSVRAHDMAARIGGDEFVVLLIGATNPVLVDTARRINERLAFELAGAGGRCLSVTCSIGVAVFPHDGLDSKGLLKRADRAMFSAKRKGKNGYCLACEEIITN